MISKVAPLREVRGGIPRSLAAPGGSIYHRAVRTRRIGPFTVSAVGGGDVCLATSAGRGVPFRDVEHAMHEAITFGITMFDVAADADSEKLAGEAVRAQRARDRVVVATRVPLLAERPGAPRRDVLPERLPVLYIQDRIEAALRATRLDALPLAQLPLRPAWLGSPAWPELVGSCARLTREGKVRQWGALIGDPTDEAAPALAAEPWLAAISVVYCLCDRRAEPLLAAAVGAERAVLARHPLAGGALAGTLGPGVKLQPRDDRGELDAPTLERIAVGAARLAALVKRAPPAAGSCDAARAAADAAVRAGRPEHLECGDVAELALRYAIDRGAIALPRLHRRDHLLPAIGATAAPPLSADLVAEIDRIFDGGR